MKHFADDPKEQYDILDEPDEKGEVAVRRVRDDLLTIAKRSWLKPSASAEGKYEARSTVKAIRMDGLVWVEAL